MSHPRSRHLIWGPEGLIPLALFFKVKPGQRPGELQILEPWLGEVQGLPYLLRLGDVRGSKARGGTGI